MKKILSLILLISVFFAGNLSAQQKVTPKGRSYYFNNFSSLKNASPLKVTQKKNAILQSLRAEELGEALGHIVLTGEIFTIGQGYFMEPAWVPFYEGETGASVLLRVLGEKGLEVKYSGSPTSGFFLSDIKGIDDGSSNYPQYILDMANWFVDMEFMDPIVPNADEWLGTYDYTEMSGWMYFENGVMAPYTMDEYIPSDGDVMRVQFSMVGWGADLGDDYWGVLEDLELEPFANKDDMMKAIADVNSATHKEILLVNEAVKTAYDKAYEVTQDVTASQATVNETTIALNEAVYAVGKVDVIITMNSVSPNIILTNNATGKSVEVGEKSSTPKNHSYNFKAEPGIYTLSAFTSETSGSLPNGTIQITITEDNKQTFELCTVTAGPNNSGWMLDTDYTISQSAVSREGVVRVNTSGTSATANKITFLMHIGDTYTVEYIPSEEQKEEGYMVYTAIVTVTNSTANVSGSIPMGRVYSITIPKEADLFVGKKYAHYVAFSEIEPSSVKEADGKKEYEFFLANSQTYNYRVSQPGKLTTAAIFTMSSSLDPLEITEETLNIDDPKRIDHDVKSNEGLNVGDILLNINAQGHLKLNQGDEYRLISNRNWQLSDNSTNNYFIEPDFYYTVVNENGTVDNSVVTVDSKGKVKAIGKGTAIVLVTYDAIYLPEDGTNKDKAYWGGPFFGAIWPENTGVFMVTVNGENTSITSHITINESLNSNALKLAGDAVDAEHDVFYYLNDTEGYDYTFTPEGTNTVTLAQPIVGEMMTNYNGFSTNGVTKNADGSYTIRLIHGRNIVKLTDINGNSEYQVFTAKPVSMEIRNTTNPGEKLQRGDKVSVVFNGFFHPANKLAGIYNMSAYVQYNGIPNGTDLILTGNQYAFGSTESAQTATFVIPQDWDTTQEFALTSGVIQVNGFGDPIGNHRNTSPDFGRNANMTAVAHKTYFGSIPSTTIKINETDYYQVTFTNLPENTTFALSKDGKAIEASEDGSYSITYGTYSYVAKNTDYRVLRESISISSKSPKTQSVEVNMTLLGTNGWDGVTLNEPQIVTAEESQLEGGQFENMEGYYKISSGYELAWFGSEVNTADVDINAILLNDIDLAGYDFTPIGKNNLNTNALAYKGIFEGADYTIEGLYMTGGKSYWALFGCIDGATIRNVSVDGVVILDTKAGTPNYNFAGIVAWANGNFTIENCHNYANITGGNYAGGILGYTAANEFTLNNCSNHGNISGGNNLGGIMGYVSGLIGTTANLYNTGFIKGTSTNVGGIVGQFSAGQAYLKNAFNTGIVEGSKEASTGAIKGYGSGNIENTYSLYEYADAVNVTLVTEEDLASGEITWLLGKAFGQKLGEESLPSLNSDEVYKADYTSNLDSETSIIFYTNGSFPEVEKFNYTYLWYNAPDGKEISEIKEDGSVYLLYSPIQVEAITFNLETVKLMETETVQLSVTFQPEDALNKELLWISSNPAVASVDDSGVVTALKEGFTTIIVISEDGRFTTRCEVTVTGYVSIDQVAINANVYPNPVQDILYIDNNGTTIDKVSITDTAGKIVYSESVNDTKLIIPVNQWNQGIYFVQIVSGDQVKNYKLIKK